MKIKYEKPQWRRKTVPTHQKSVKIPVRLFRDERVNFNKLLALSTSASVYKRSFQGHEILFFISKIRGDFECRIWIADGFIPRYFPIKIYFFRFINLEVQSQQNEKFSNFGQEILDFFNPNSVDRPQVDASMDVFFRTDR